MHPTVSQSKIKMIKFYLHVAELYGWETLFYDIVQKMGQSRLLDSADEINFCVSGNLNRMSTTLGPIADLNPNFRIRHLSDDPHRWEWPTINAVHTDALADNELHYVGYGHLKGNTRFTLNRPEDRDWRNYLTYWTMERWADQVEKLEEGYDCSGVNWLDNPQPHFSGNSWWARTDYIRKLEMIVNPAEQVWGTPSKFLRPNILLDPGNFKFECEAWIGSGNPNYYEIHGSQPKDYVNFHYENLYPPELYRS